MTRIPSNPPKTPPDTCLHCGGAIALRNPTGTCDHLYWPNNLSDEAKRANGYKPEVRHTIVWTKRTRAE